MSDQKQNLRLVELVREHPCLYNPQLPEYSRKDFVESAWTKVGLEVKIPASICKERWRNLRSVFMRHIKPNPNASAKKKRSYYLLDAMQFIIPYLKTANTTDHCHLPGNDKEQAHIEATELLIIKEEFDVDDNLKRKSSEETLIQPPKKAQTSTNATNQSEATKMFLLSLLPELEELSDAQLKVFKRRVLHLIDEISETSEDYVRHEEVALSPVKSEPLDEGEF